MLGLILIYVGLILLHNGIAGILNFDKKSFAFLNIVVGCIALFCQLIYLIFLIQNNATNTAFLHLLLHYYLVLHIYSQVLIHYFHGTQDLMDISVYLCV